MGFLFQQEEKLDILLESQENLRSTQANLEKTLALSAAAEEEHQQVRQMLAQNQELLAAAQQTLEQTRGQEEENSLKNAQHIALLKASQENLAATQCNLSRMAEFYERNLAALSQPEVSQEAVFTPEEQRRAAYALNSCTVSVSQIIDYDDVYILEQEYESILNNLNLEVMPKDEALLGILTQLLNVITFFRIQEGDKAMLDREYQQRIKNAIWAAVPNIGLIVSGGGLAGAVSSLVSQVGIGYMNYRREKANAALEDARQRWQLTRSAMEQFHALRRELFDTAWRLADKYHFPDEYRITERQISIYNRILMEPNPLKRYERLEYIQDKFLAYPPFTYYLASAANMVALSEDQYDKETRAFCREKAAALFDAYLKETDQNLFREDQIRASCALEYFDLLYHEHQSDEGQLCGLLETAIQAAGNSFDVLELCAFGYAKLGHWDKAAKLLRMLVNEGYNTIVNAQLLSSLYVRELISSPSHSTRQAYLTLAGIVEKEHLFPMPDSAPGADSTALNSKFLNCQKRILVEHFADVLRKIVKKYTILYNKTIPTAAEEPAFPEEYYRDEYESIVLRRENIQLALLENPREFRIKLQTVVQDMMDVLNSLHLELGQFPLAIADTILLDLQRGIRDHKGNFNAFLKAISDQSADITMEDVDAFLCLSFERITGAAFMNMAQRVFGEISGFTTMLEVSEAEEALRSFCRQQSIPLPELDWDNRSADSLLCPQGSLNKISMSLLGNGAAVFQKNQEILQKMEACISDVLKKGPVISEKGKNTYAFYTKDSQYFQDYYRRHNDDMNGIALFNDIIAILNQRTWQDEDWIFTRKGIYKYARSSITRKSMISRKTMTGPIPYNQVHASVKNTIEIAGCSLSGESFEVSLFLEMMRGLDRIGQQYAVRADSSQQTGVYWKEPMDARIYRTMLGWCATKKLH